MVLKILQLKIFGLKYIFDFTPSFNTSFNFLKYKRIIKMNPQAFSEYFETS